MSLYARCLTLVLVVFALSSAPAPAQDAPKPFVLASYYYCPQANSPRADAIVKEHIVPFLKAEQAAGRITGYGWNAHVEGGSWRRLMFVTGTSLGAVVDTRDGMGKLRGSAEHAKAFEEFGQLCPNHNDYVWRVESSSVPASEVGRSTSPFMMSTYYECDADESEADAIVASTIGPLLSERVKAGKIDGWAWAQHIFGGQYRRLFMLSGKSEKSLLENWLTLQDDLQKASPDMARRLGNICHGHSDYIWANALN